MRARHAGFTLLLAPGTVGSCVRDGPRAPWLDQAIPIRQRTRLLLGRKGVPPGSRARYLRRHGGVFWPIFWVSPYCRFLLSLLRPLSPSWTKR
jgi:hypothetical protein